MIAHEEAGLPPLDFASETILDARSFDRPANYALPRINCHLASREDLGAQRYSLKLGAARVAVWPGE